MSDSQDPKNTPIRCGPAVCFAISTELSFHDIQQNIQKYCARARAHAHTPAIARSVTCCTTPVCVFRIISRTNSDCPYEQHRQVLCIIEKQCVCCEVGNNISMLFVCIPHQRSLFSSVTAIPPTPPLVLVLTYEATNMSVRAWTLRKQREAQRRVNCGPVGCQQRILLQSVSQSVRREAILLVHRCSVLIV